jgi:hypothetical protein
VFALASALLMGVFPLAANATPNPVTPSIAQTRSVEPVVLTGSQFPDWSAGAEISAKLPGTPPTETSCPADDSDGLKHNCSAKPEVFVPPPRPGVNVDDLIGYRWVDGRGFVQIPFQVDQKFNRYISNFASNCTAAGPFCVGFGAYAGTDQQPSYAFDRDIYKYTAGECTAEPTGGPEQDPIPGLDDNDEMAFLVKDAGAQAPAGATPPPGITQMREVRIDDPSQLPGTPPVYAYVGLSDGSVHRAYDASNGYMRYVRDTDSFRYLQTSGNYGNAPKGDVCDADGNVIAHNVPRRPKDTAWVLSPRYAFRYASRWELRGVRVNPDKNATRPLASPDDYNPPLLDEWKARAYAQTRSDNTPCCGFENESFSDWGRSSVTLGEKVGPVRVIRTTWGADSGTNTIRTEIFYPDEIVQQTYLRVHPIPPLGGIFSYWDHTASTETTTYYNPEIKEGVPVDGKNDEVLGTGYVALHQGGVELRDDDPLFVDHPVRVGSQDGCITECTDVDVTDPTLDATGSLAWEEVARRDGTMIFRTRLNTDPSHLSPGDVQGVISLPYYRDDACFDDGTGTDPGPPNRPDLPCYTQSPTGPWHQGLFGAHGVQVLMTPESDNVGPAGTVPVDEVDAETRIVVLPGDAGNVGESYGHAADVPLVTTVTQPGAIPAAPGLGVPVADQTTIAYNGDTSGVIGHTARLAATLTDRLGPVSGATLHFTFQGMVHDATTDSNGQATTTVAVNEPAGPNDLVVDYDGDGALRPATSTQTTFVAKREPTITFDPSSATSGAIGSTTTFVAKLADSAGPVSGATLRFEFQGTTHDATTDRNGAASSSFPVNGPTGSANVVVRFDGDDVRTAASTTVPFEVDKRASAIMFTARPARRGSVIVDVTLTDKVSGAGLADEAVVIAVNGATKATVTTDGSGHASARLAMRPAGKTFSVSFAGDDTYAGSTAQGTFAGGAASGSS